MNQTEYEKALAKFIKDMEENKANRGRASPPSEPNHLVKVFTDSQGDEIYDPKWCLVIENRFDLSTFCEGVVFGFGDGDSVFEEKWVQRGITCEKCREKIKMIKAVKL